MRISQSTVPKMIDASRLLLAKFPVAENDYEHGWNDALQTAYDVETEREEVTDNSEFYRKNHG